MIVEEVRDKLNLIKKGFKPPYAGISRKALTMRVNRWMCRFHEIKMRVTRKGGR